MGIVEAGIAVRILIVDDHALLRMGTRQILSEAADLELVGEASSCASDALNALERLRPDLVILDERVSDMKGIELARAMTERSPSTRIVILSAWNETDDVHAALEAGVTGYLPKSIPGEELVRAIRAVASGMMILDAEARARLRARSLRFDGGMPIGLAGDPYRIAAMTWRDKQVVELVARGLANRSIASRLGVSAHSLEGHLNHLFKRLGATSRAELARLTLGRSTTP